jgi:hypothetical protein
MAAQVGACRHQLAFETGDGLTPVALARLPGGALVPLPRFERVADLEQVVQRPGAPVLFDGPIQIFQGRAPWFGDAQTGIDHPLLI